VPERALETLDSATTRRLAEFLDGKDEQPASSLTEEDGKIIYHLKPFDGGKEKQ
jgi:hypothetical protein